MGFPRHAVVVGRQVGQGARLSGPLLVLPDERIAQETQRWGQIAADEAAWYRAWRRRLLLLLLRCGASYTVGGIVAWGSLTLNGENAQIALWGGLLLSNLAPLSFGYAFWMRENGTWS